jgi:hypothetical protein
MYFFRPWLYFLKQWQEFLTFIKIEERIQTPKKYKNKTHQTKTVQEASKEQNRTQLGNYRSKNRSAREKAGRD